MLTTHIGKLWWKFSFQNNHLVGRILTIKEKKFSPGPGFEPGSPALRAGATTNKRRIPDRLGGLVVIAQAHRAGDPGSWFRRGVFLFNTTYQMAIPKTKFSSRRSLFLVIFFILLCQLILNSRIYEWMLYQAYYYS